MNLLGGDKQVLSASLNHIEHDHRFLFQPGKALTVFVVVLHLRNIPEINDITFLLLYDNIFQLLGIVILSHHTDSPPHIVVENIPS